MADSPYPKVSKEILFHPTHRFLKLCLGWSFASSQPRVTPLTIPIHPCPYSASTNAVTLSIWLINLQGGNYQHQGKFSDDINTSSKTILQEYLYWNDRLPFCVIGTCSPVRICLHFCVAYLHLMVGARLWILWIWKWWQRQIAGPRKFSIRKQKSMRSREQAKNTVKTLNCQWHNDHKFK